MSTPLPMCVRPSCGIWNTLIPLLYFLRTEFEGYSTDETVKVVMSGNQEPRSVDFTDEALEAGSEVRACTQLSMLVHLPT